MMRYTILQSGLDQAAMLLAEQWFRSRNERFRTIHLAWSTDSLLYSSPSSQPHSFKIPKFSDALRFFYTDTASRF